MEENLLSTYTVLLGEKKTNKHHLKSQVIVKKKIRLYPFLLTIHPYLTHPDINLELVL